MSKSTTTVDTATQNVTDVETDYYASGDGATVTSSESKKFSCDATTSICTTTDTTTDKTDSANTYTSELVTTLLYASGNTYVT